MLFFGVNFDISLYACAQVMHLYMYMYTLMHWCCTLLKNNTILIESFYFFFELQKCNADKHPGVYTYKKITSQQIELI